jgi:hypothetical protein
MIGYPRRGPESDILGSGLYYGPPYGDGSLYPSIFEGNRDILKDPNLIKVGQKLRIP